MSRQEEEFDVAAKRVSRTKRTADAQAQCEYDFTLGCEYGYQYAVEKACEWLRNNLEYYLGDYNLAEDELEDNQVHYAAMLEELRKAMEE